MDPPQTTPVPGLSAREAARRLARVGPNEPATARRFGALVFFFHTLASPLVGILLLASVVSGILGDPVSAGIVVGMVGVSTVVDFLQSSHSQRAADRLRARVAPSASVLRDGVWAEVACRLVVPGDAVRLKAGDLVPADALVLSAEHLHVEQAALTGESVPVEKRPAPDPDAGPGGAPDDPGRVFLGTSVTSGSGVVRVVATGDRTAFGEIVRQTAARPPENEFERGMRELSLLVTRAVVFLMLFVFLVGAALRHDPMESLLFAVALAVGMTPEFLPMITTVTLGRGAVRMARRKVIVKRLPAIENLGGMDILCSDKTGTLTTESMALEAWCDPDGTASPAVLALARLNSRFETGIRNPLDAAVLAAPPVAGEPDYADAVRRGELPFDFERRRLSVAVEQGGRGLLVTKGAPEGVVARCARRRAPDGGAAPLDDAGRASAVALYDSLSARGYRVLAVATRTREADAPPPRLDDESDMVLEGFLGFVNPPLPGAAAAIERLRGDGVTVKILTGDNEIVTERLCRSVGIDPGVLVRGDDLDRLDDTALGSLAERASVFARMSPAQKNRVLLALKRRGHVVGYIGDGINDAPALHTADVGISVASAVDVARDAASIVLMEKSLQVLHAGVIEGRHAYGNVLKYLLMNLSSNYGNMLSMAVASLALPFLPMLPAQVLLNNFLYDLSQITIPTDRVDERLVRRPRRWDMAMIRRFMLWAGPVSSLYDLLTFWALRGLFHASAPLFHTGWFVESLATQTLVIFAIRTAGPAWRSRPSPALSATMAGVVALGILLPFTPLGPPLGFVPLPAGYFAFLVGATATYLGLMEWLKRRLLRGLA